MTPYLFILPSLVFVISFLIFPLVYSFCLSFTDYNFVYKPTFHFTGFSNYYKMWEDENFLIAFSNTIKFVFGFLPLLVGLSLVIAILLDENKVGTDFLRSLIFLPIIASMALTGVMFMWILNERYGILNFIFEELFKMPFLSHNWLNEANTALPSLVVVTLWKTIGIPVIIFTASLNAISKDMREASMIDGANFWQKYIYVIIPNLKGAFMIVMIWGIIQAFKLFEIPFIMTKGGPGRSTFVLYMCMWSNGFEYYEMGYAASLAYFLGLIVGIIAFLNLIVFKK